MIVLELEKLINGERGRGKGYKLQGCGEKINKLL